MLVSFAANPGESGILVTWETASEVENLGFNVYRAIEVDGPLTQLNAGLVHIWMPGSSDGGSYAYLDGAVVPDTTYYYWLEAVDVRGGTHRHGPVVATSQPAAVYRIFLPSVSR
jgi:hypothetical protein